MPSITYTVVSSFANGFAVLTPRTRKARGARTGLEVQVFGKRVRLDRASPPPPRGGTASPPSSSFDSDGWDTEDDSSSSAGEGYDSGSDDGVNSDASVDRDGTGYRGEGSSGDSSEGSDTGTWDDDEEDDDEEDDDNKEEEEEVDEEEDVQEEEEGRDGNDPSDDGDENNRDDTENRGTNSSSSSSSINSSGGSTNNGEGIRTTENAEAGEDTQTASAARVQTAHGRSRDVETTPPVPRQEPGGANDYDGGEWSAGFEPSEGDGVGGGSAEAEWVAGFGKSPRPGRRETIVESAAGDENSVEEGEDGAAFSDVATDGDSWSTDVDSELEGGEAWNRRVTEGGAGSWEG